MSHLSLELRQNERMIINGASMRFLCRARIELTSHARFLFGKQIMFPEAADTPTRRLYLALQTAYIGADAERVRGLEDARVLTAALKAATPSPTVRDMLDRALAAAEGNESYAALKLVRQVIQIEDEVLGRAPASAQ